ncbi:hypothetical protein [Sinorhizobium fredii]|uniref:hypothetical protein n=1 Tax=Rhizobium fredii TaxID=380 RepID=UPI0012969DAE|nr:hypothetical protein [Sinorhizobium fredii]MQW95804.1 hypothetical protein [Sinorhizobium fredii]UTY46533.1 hypothetical protein EPK84_06475 [Sinorhizobium fredii]
MPQKQDNGDPGKAGPAGRRPHRTAQSPDVAWPARRLGPQPQRTGESDLAPPESASGEDHVADASDVGSGVQDLRAEMSVDPPQPSPRDYSGGGKPIRPKHHDSQIAEESSAPDFQENGDDGTGGDAWNRVLGNTTNAGMLRLLAAIGLFILVSGAFFWLVT